MRNHNTVCSSTGLVCAVILLATTSLALPAEPTRILISEGVTENFPKSLRAVKFVDAGNFAAAKDLLLVLKQQDFARKPRKELKSENEVEFVRVPAIGNRDLLLARCHMELKEHKAARVLLWGLIQKECTTQDLFLLFIREFQGKDSSVAIKKLDDIQKDFPRNDAALLARQYLTVAQALPDGDIRGAVHLIRSGAWSRDSERGPLAEFKEWACAQLAKHPEATVPILLDALEANEQPTWIIYCLGQSGSQRALAPLKTARERIKNYNARLEIDAAIAKINKANEKNVEQENSPDKK